MSQDWQRAELSSFGLAVTVQAAAGRCLQLSYEELRRRLNLPAFKAGAALPRLAAPELRGNTLHLRIDDREHELALSHAPRPRVFHNTSMLMTGLDPQLGLIRDGSLVTLGSEILWAGPHSELDRAGLDLKRADYVDVGGRLLTPGLVDSHTHPIFAGERADEFARRARGDHYLDIAKEGGGIQATLGPTRAASIEEHISLCSKRMARALAWGTTTLEAKSGYDLRVEGELRLLQIARMVDALQPVSISPTLLGAHLIPAEYHDDRSAYVRAVAEEMVPRAAREHLADAVDVYCDEGAFTIDETRTILQAAAQHGLRIKAHIGQFADLGGAELLAELSASSGDHLEQVSSQGIAAMAKAGVIATMLPGACVQLKMAPPPVAALRRAGVQLALASDLNPGTSHSETLTLPLWLACTHYGMTVEEAWLGVTRVAAKAIGKSNVGALAAGMQADFVVWDAEIPGEVASHFGVNLVHAVYVRGERA